MSIFEPSPAAPDPKGWFAWNSGHGHHHGHPDHPPTGYSDQPPTGYEGESITRVETQVGSGLIARLRDVFVPTPDPSLAPQHPVDPLPGPSSSASSLASHTEKKKLHFKHGSKTKSGKLVDYINTLEISSKENANSKEAVVVMHGYAAAMG